MYGKEAEGMNSTRKVLEIINSYKISNALFLLGEFGVFEWLSKAHSVSDICSKVPVNQEALSILLDLFVSIGLLYKSQDNCYGISSEYKELLSPDSPSNLIDLIKLESYLSDKHLSYENMKKVLVTGEGTDTFNRNSKEGKEQLYINTMDKGNRFTAACVARELRGIKKGRILDIGGGSGIYSIATVKLNRSLEIDIVDKQEVRELCEKNIWEAGFSECIRFISGDINALTFSMEYQGVILSNILHLMTQDEIERLFTKLNPCLSHNSTLVFHDFFINDNHPLIPAVYTLDWMMHGSFFRFRSDEFSSYIERFGWKLKAVKHFGNVESTIITANKE